MSLPIMDEILEEIGIKEKISHNQEVELYEEVKDNFDIIGSYDDLNCEDLKKIWMLRKEEVTKFIKEWIAKRRIVKAKKKKKKLIEVVA